MSSAYYVCRSGVLTEIIEEEEEGEEKTEEEKKDELLKELVEETDKNSEEKIKQTEDFGTVKTLYTDTLYKSKIL